MLGICLTHNPDFAKFYLVMKKKECFIVEDNKQDRDLLVSYIEKTPFLSLSGTATNYATAANFILSNEIDILFVDVELSEEKSLSGLDLIKTLPKLPQIVIVSNHSEYAIDSYELGKAADFLLKPFNYERFLIATNRAIFGSATNLTKSESSSIVFFKVGRKHLRFDLDKVLYFQSFGIYVKVFTEGAKNPEIINETISSIANYLDTSTFIRVHKLYVLNINKISGFDANNFFIDGKSLPIGISYKVKLENLFKILMNLDE